MNVQMHSAQGVCGQCTKSFQVQRYQHRRIHKANSFTKRQIQTIDRQIFCQAQKPSASRAKNTAYLRTEVENPFRLVRLYGFGAAAVGGAVGLFISAIQLIAVSVGKRPDLTFEGTLQTIGLDLVFVAIAAALALREKKGQDKVQARINREELLSQLKVQFTNGKIIEMDRLRGSSRPVIILGTQQQLVKAIQAAEQYKADLMDRGVFIVPVQIDGGESESKEDQQYMLSLQTEDNLKYLGKPVLSQKWNSWFSEQIGLANVTTERGLFISLRMDGRVRSSGVGVPPWYKIAATLAPVKGMWSGFLDGMDGKVY